MFFTVKVTIFKGRKFLTTLWQQTSTPQKLEFKQMIARRTRKSPRNILGVCEGRFIAV